MNYSKNTKIMTRAELFDLVWTKPMIDLAKERNISDNGLRKVCRKFKVPVPKMGYWQKVRYGKPTKKSALPSYDGEDKILIKMMPRMKEMLTPIQLISEPIVVPEHISSFHPLVKQTRSLFSEKRKCLHRFDI